MKASRVRRKTRLRQRILSAFSFVLFFSFFFTWIIFNFAMRLSVPGTEDQYLSQQVAASGLGITFSYLVSSMFVVSMVVSFFLANSITRPIVKLGKYALGIGKGNFETNNFEFQDIELEELNTALNTSVKELEAYDRRQKEFFQNASHELRTPLMSIKIYGEGIVYGLMDPKEAGETILQETDRLSELVTDLLYIAKIGDTATTYTTENVDLVGIIRQSIARQQPVADKRQIEFVFGFEVDEIFYECVPELISRAVDNLISNALRYAMSKIMVSCHKAGSKIIIRVEDDGSGIEDEALPKVFERFYKGKDGNVGIGLAIVKSIAEQHKGEIQAENGENGGAVFTLTLPIT